MNPTVKKFLPHIIAFFVLMIVSFIRFAPVVFEGKTLQQTDNIQAIGMQMEMRKVKEETGEFPLWTNSMFAGMPSYQILYVTKSLIKPVSRLMLLGNNMAPPHTGILLMMAGFYLLMVVLKVDWRLAIFGAVGFGLAANHLGLVEAGHSTKIIASAYMAPILAGIILTFRGKYWIGGGLTALFTALQLYANHVQITYYLFLTLIIFGAVYLYDAYKKGAIPQFLTASGVTAVAILLALATNAGRLLTTQEYAEETIRGKSELSEKQGSTGSVQGEDGLSKDYAFGWSYGILETYNLLIPNFVGGSSTESFASDPNSATINALRQMGNAEQATALAQRTTHYWGTQPFTGGGVYMGAVFILLFFLGAFLVKSPLRWYVIGSVILTIILAWGDNFKTVNYLIFDHFPFYNKFRAVTMALGITNFLIVLLGVLGLQRFLDKGLSEDDRKKALLKAGGIAGGLVVLGLLLSFGLDYMKEGENFPDIVAAAVADDRAALLRADALRSLLFIALSFGVLWFWVQKRFSALAAVAAVGLLAVIDVWGIGTRFVNAEDYLSPVQKSGITAPTETDRQIMADPDPYFRVADFRRNPFSNAITSYHHLSMGGYHAAKLMRYQEMIERYLGDPGNNGHIYGMFNAKYFINQQGQALRNPDALGNAWFVSSYETVPDGDAEIAALAELDPSQKAIIQDGYADALEGFDLQYDSTATIQLTSYHPDEMVYSYNAATDQLAVFSEMYYPPSKGWKMFIDGAPAPDFMKANFTLRAAVLPAGQHELKMVFAPEAYYTGENISLISSILVLLLAAFGIYWFFRNYQLPDPAQLPDHEPVAKTRTKTTVRKTKSRKKR